MKFLGKKGHIEFAILNFLTKQSFSFSKNIYATGLRVLRRSDNPFIFKIMILSKCNFFSDFLCFRRHIEKSGGDSEKRTTGTERAEKNKIEHVFSKSFIDFFL